VISVRGTPIWDGDSLTGFIDWDFAAPGHAMDDVAQLAWYAVPLRPLDPERAPWLADVTVLRTRLEAICSAYEAEPAAVLHALDGLQEHEADRIRREGARGVEPWAGFLARGDAAEMGEERNGSGRTTARCSAPREISRGEPGREGVRAR